MYSNLYIDFAWNPNLGYDYNAVQHAMEEACEASGVNFEGFDIESVEYPAKDYPDLSDKSTSQISVTFSWVDDYNSDKIVDEATEQLEDLHLTVLGTDFESVEVSEGPETLTNVNLSEAQFFIGDAEERTPTFAMEAYTDEGDIVWVGQNEEDLTRVEYVLASAAQGDIYHSSSLTNVLRELKDRFYVPRDLMEQIADYAEQFIYI